MKPSLEKKIPADSEFVDQLEAGMQGRWANTVTAYSRGTIALTRDSFVAANRQRVH